MFFDNKVYYDFVDRCRKVGITVPIIPGLKPIVTRRQATLLPKVFGVKLPEELVVAIGKCEDDMEAKQVGVDWCVNQAEDLYSHGIPSIHFYSHNAVPSVHRILDKLFS